MQTAAYEDLVESAADELAEIVFGIPYDQLAPGLQEWIRELIENSLRSEYAHLALTA